MRVYVTTILLSIYLGVFYACSWDEVVFRIRWQLYRADNVRVAFLCRTYQGVSIKSLVSDPTAALTSSQLRHFFGKPDLIQPYKLVASRGSPDSFKRSLHIPAGSRPDGEEWQYHDQRISVTLDSKGKCIWTDAYSFLY